MMRKSLSLLAATIGGWALLASAPAATKVDRWTYVGGGLSGNSYGTPGNPNYHPSVLIPDAAANNGATIGVVIGTEGDARFPGGLGSSGFGDYGTYYTFFSKPVTFTLQTSTVLAGIDTITVSFDGSGGTPAFTASSLTLNFNVAHSAVAVAPGDFLKVSLGDDGNGGEAFDYTWTWHVASFGTSTGFSTQWVATEQHTSFGNIELTQISVPEPSSAVLAALGVGGLCGFRRRPRKTAIAAL